MKRIYLDSNVLIAYHSQDKAEELKKRMVEEAFRGRAAIYGRVSVRIDVRPLGPGFYLRP